MPRSDGEDPRRHKERTPVLPRVLTVLRVLALLLRLLSIWHW